MNEIEKYLAGLDSVARNAIEEIRACVKNTVPESEELINYHILAFALTAGGKRDRQVMVAGYKNHIGFYPGPETISHFANQLAGYKNAKGSMQFPLNKPIPLSLITEMLKHRVEVINNS